MINIKQVGACESLAVLLSVSACSGTGEKVGTDNDLMKQLEAKQAALAQKESQLQAREAALGNGKVGAQTVAATGAEMLPPNAQAGQCFTRVWMPPKYKTVESRKLVSEAGERIEVVPAKYAKVKKRVMVQEAATKLVSVPATYRTVIETVVVQPARTVTETVPPLY